MCTLIEEHKTNHETVLSKKLNMHMSKSFDSATDSKELQRTEEFIKSHHRDAISRITLW